jgi:hypothetical protein
MLEMKKGDVIRFNNMFVKKEFKIEVGQVSGRKSDINGHNNATVGAGDV